MKSKDKEIVELKTLINMDQVVSILETKDGCNIYTTIQDESPIVVFESFDEVIKRLEQ
jgi:hypothetical protein